MGVFSQALKDEVSSLAESRWEGSIGGNDVVLVAKPLSPLDMQAVTKKHRDFMSNPNVEGMVDLIMRKARAEGADTVAFEAVDRPYLMRLSMEKISGIFGALFRDQLESDADEEIEKQKGN